MFVPIKRSPLTTVSLNCKMNSLCQQALLGWGKPSASFTLADSHLFLGQQFIF